MSVGTWTRARVKAVAGRAGFSVQRAPDPLDGLRRERGLFVERVEPIAARQRAQGADEVRALRARYADPIFGSVRVYDLVERLALCIDPLDARLGCVSQLTHTLQVVEGMVDDGIDDPDLLVAALIHDVGKLLLLVGEDPANVGGSTRPIGEYAPGVGLDACVMQWGHDEFAYSRFAGHVTEPVAWLLRYHSLRPDAGAPLMDETDLRYARDYGAVLARYDRGTKSMFDPPRTRLADYRDLLDAAFPAPIPF